MIKPNKLMIVRNEQKAAEIRKHLSDDWMVIGYMSAITGRRFNLILLTDQITRNRPDQYQKYMMSLKAKLSIGGELIEVY